MTFSKEFFSVAADNVENLPWKINNIQYYLVLSKLGALYFQRERLATLAVSEAVVRRCSSKYVIWKISQILHENTCVAVSL